MSLIAADHCEPLQEEKVVGEWSPVDVVDEVVVVMVVTIAVAHGHCC